MQMCMNLCARVQITLEKSFLHDSSIKNFILRRLTNNFCFKHSSRKQFLRIFSRTNSKQPEQLAHYGKDRLPIRQQYLCTPCGEPRRHRLTR
jgi:hypothetical protein